MDAKPAGSSKVSPQDPALPRNVISPMNSKDKNGEMCVACWELMIPLFQRAGFSSLLQASFGHCSGRPTWDSTEPQSHQVALILDLMSSVLLLLMSAKSLEEQKQ